MRNNQKGFTLIEMMIVLLVISILLIITIPNITKHNSTINSKGCEAFKKMVEAQVQAYEMDNPNTAVSISTLLNEKYLTQTSCPNGNEVEINAEGKVVEKVTPDAPQE